MARLVPYPFGALVRRMLTEVDRSHAIFDLPVRHVVRLDASRDLGVSIHGRRASTPFGPAAGPHTQLAQNIVLSWLVGGRILELKTIQVNDEIRVARPCIDMETVGFNTEWSQELKLHESLEEYVKASMLIDLLAASGRLPVERSAAGTVFDVSVGYDLTGIRSEPVRSFLSGMRDAAVLVDRLRHEIPSEGARYRELDFRTGLSDSVTLSTFHGCPPEEIERIALFLMRELGLHVTVKLNPTLLGRQRTEALLRDALGYREIEVPGWAFERDMGWDQAVEMVDRLRQAAAEEEVGFGVKLTNTLVVANHRRFFPPGETVMYLSGPPLHVLAVALVARARRELGDTLPISFSAGVDRANFPDVAALGVVPVSACTDLLKVGGYARARRYFDALARRMDEAGARTIGDFVIRAFGLGGAALDEVCGEAARAQACRTALDEGTNLRAAAGDALYARWVARAASLNTSTYAERVAGDARYRRDRNQTPPRKIGRSLKLFDCLSCDICIPVCPNDANFKLAMPPMAIPIIKARRTGRAWTCREEGTFVLAEAHQIANFADFCNDCGNCDVFCPEDGGPYAVKPRFFGSLAGWRGSGLDGFFVDRCGQGERIVARIDGRETELTAREDALVFAGRGFAVAFDRRDVAGTLSGDAASEVDLTWALLLDAIRRAVLSPSAVNYVGCLLEAQDATT